MKRFVTILFLLILPAAANARAQTFQVEHDHLLRSCKGKLVFGDANVEFISEKKEHSRAWKYEDIQQLALDPGRISILTYDSRKIELGADQAFNFKLTSGTLGEEFRQEIEKKLTRPIVSSSLPERIRVRFSIPARHRLFLSSSQGVLEFGDECVLYRSKKPIDSRVWRYAELLSIGSTGPFQLRIGALQKTGGEYGEEKNYVFDLKRRLLPEEYDFIWEKINRSKTSGRNQ
jgi:hypothetical protein